MFQRLYPTPKTLEDKVKLALKVSDIMETNAATYPRKPGQGSNEYLLERHEHFADQVQNACKRFSINLITYDTWKIYASGQVEQAKASLRKQSMTDITSNPVAKKFESLKKEIPLYWPRSDRISAVGHLGILERSALQGKIQPRARPGMPATTSRGI